MMNPTGIYNHILNSLKDMSYNTVTMEIIANILYVEKFELSMYTKCTISLYTTSCSHNSQVLSVGCTFAGKFILI